MSNNGFVQGLFWNNLKTAPESYQSNIPVFLRPLVKNTFLKKKSQLYFIYTGTGKISLDSLPISTNHIKLSKEKVIDFYLYEPVSYYFKDVGYTNVYYSEFDSLYDRCSNLAVAELDSLQNLSNQIQKPIRVFHGDYGINCLVGDRYPQLTMLCMDIFLKSVMLNSYNFRNHEKIINKKFWCGNRRYSAHRHLIMSYLLGRSGNYSWRFIIDDADYLDHYSWVSRDLSSLARHTRERLNSQNYILDINNQKINVKNQSCSLIPTGPYCAEASKQYIEKIRECFCSVVTETRFAQPTGNFSEKTADAINYGNPFIVVGPPTTLKYIQNLGFKTFDKWWDESYDKEKNHSLRMKKIFDVIDFIDSLSINDLTVMYREMLPIITHNKRIYMRFPYYRKIVNHNK